MIHVRSHESDTAPVDLGSYSSRVTFMNANAAIRAALEIREQILKAAWDILGYHPNTLVLNDRRIYYKHDPSIGVSYLKALHKAQAALHSLMQTIARSANCAAVRRTAGTMKMTTTARALFAHGTSWSRGSIPSRPMPTHLIISILKMPAMNWEHAASTINATM